MQRKRMEVPVDPNEVKVHEGYTLGQVIYCFRYPDKQPCRGTITRIHLGESAGPYHTFTCDVTGKFYKALFADTMVEPTPKVREAVERLIDKERRTAKALEEKLRAKGK